MVPCALKNSGRSSTYKCPGMPWTSHSSRNRRVVKQCWRPNLKFSKVEILDGIDEGLYGWVTVNAKVLGRGQDWDLVSLKSKFTSLAIHFHRFCIAVS